MIDVKNIIGFYNNEVSTLNEEYESKGQGAVRDLTGKLYENLCNKILKEIDPKLSIRKNDYLTLPSKSGKYKLNNIQVEIGRAHV